MLYAQNNLNTSTLRNTVTSQTLNTEATQAETTLLAETESFILIKKINVELHLTSWKLFPEDTCNQFI